MTNEELTTLITTIKDIAKVECAKILSDRNVESVLYGTVTSIDGSNYTVIIAGGGEEYTTLKNKSSSYLSVGDNVIIKAIDGNTGNGYIAAKLGESFDISNVFWADEEGAHISTNRSSTVGKNLLINEDGMKIRDGVNNLATYTDAGAVIGKDTNSQINIGSSAISLTVPESVTLESNVMLNIGVDNTDASILTIDEFKPINGTFGSRVYSSKPILNSTLSYIYLHTGDGSRVELVDGDYHCHLCFIDLEVGGMEKWLAHSEASLIIGYYEVPYLPYAIIGALKNSNTEKGFYSFSQGYDNEISGGFSFASGASNSALGAYSQAFGTNCRAEGLCSHAEGDSTQAIGDSSHAENDGTYASGVCSHASGDGTRAIGYCSHTEGYHTKARGSYSHAQGVWTTASGDNQMVIGSYNIDDPTGTYAFIIGGGGGVNIFGNLFTVDRNGNVKIKGTLTQNATW